MKTSPLKKYMLAGLIFTAALLGSCKKETPDDITPSDNPAVDNVSVTPADTTQTDTTAAKPILRKNSEDGTNSAL